MSQEQIIISTIWWLGCLTGWIFGWIPAFLGRLLLAITDTLDNLGYYKLRDFLHSLNFLETDWNYGDD